VVGGYVDVTVWDYTDKVILGVFPDHGAAFPWDKGLKGKPTYDGIVDGRS
jgi:hypothetical protein